MKINENKGATINYTAKMGLCMNKRYKAKRKKKQVKMSQLFIFHNKNISTEEGIKRKHACSKSVECFCLFQDFHSWANKK
jgi:hypothetical protein